MRDKHPISAWFSRGVSLSKLIVGISSLTIMAQAALALLSQRPEGVVNSLKFLAYTTDPVITHEMIIDKHRLELKLNPSLSLIGATQILELYTDDFSELDFTAEQQLSAVGENGLLILPEGRQFKVRLELQDHTGAAHELNLIGFRKNCLSFVIPFAPPEDSIVKNQGYPKMDRSLKFVKLMASASEPLNVSRLVWHLESKDVLSAPPLIFLSHLLRELP